MKSIKITKILLILKSIVTKRNNLYQIIKIKNAYKLKQGLTKRQLINHQINNIFVMQGTIKK